MANRNLNARQQQKHDTSSNFNSKNATYLEGEILIESDTGRVKIADEIQIIKRSNILLELVYQQMPSLQIPLILLVEGCPLAGQPFPLLILV